MTVRLVALMSVVLLISLGAFGLLVGHYQDQVMREVERTASTVGQETLRNIEFKTSADGAAAYFPADKGDVMIWHSAFGRGEIRDTRVAAVRTRVVTDEPRASQITVTCDVPEPGKKDCVTRTEGDVEMVGKFLIAIEDVRAEADPTLGLVLRIPSVLPEIREAAELARAGASHSWTFEHGAELVELEPFGPDGATDVSFGPALQEVELPIPTTGYQKVFDAMRRRSLLLFLGVFLVGTVLSAGVASRFTRPIRRLDAGIRRITDGDLEAGVDVRGKDEMARLGAAFNTMTRQLRENRERGREMMRREKLTALGRLAAGVAHDVRNPLHSIGLTLDHLGEACRPETDERAGDFDRSVEIIRGEIRRLDRLVGNFLRFAASDRQERKRVNLRELIQDVVRLLHKEAERRGIEIELSLDHPVTSIEADEESLRSSVLNLLLNGFEAMPDGGRLSLTVRREGEEIIVEVADTGCGIPEEDQDRVFDFAYTTRDGGSGMGLAMVHQCVVEDHGGRVLLDSRPGEGTRVTLVFPVDPPGVPEKA